MSVPISSSQSRDSLIHSSCTYTPGTTTNTGNTSYTKTHKVPALLESVFIIIQEMHNEKQINKQGIAHCNKSHWEAVGGWVGKDSRAG